MVTLLPLLKSSKENIHAQVHRRHHRSHLSDRLGRGGPSSDADLLMVGTAGEARGDRVTARGRDRDWFPTAWGKTHMAFGFGVAAYPGG